MSYIVFTQNLKVGFSACSLFMTSRIDLLQNWWGRCVWVCLSVYEWLRTFTKKISSTTSWPKWPNLFQLWKLNFYRRSQQWFSIELPNSKNMNFVWFHFSSVQSTNYGEYFKFLGLDFSWTYTRKRLKCDINDSNYIQCVWCHLE